MNIKKIAVLLGAALLAGSLSVSAQEGKFGADRHVARGIACQTCHGNDMKSPEYPDGEKCMQCHPKAALIEKTKGLETNPHNAPHNGDCTLCHMQHEPPVNYCAQCHKFDFKVR